MKFEGTNTLPSLIFEEDQGTILIEGKAVDVECRENFWNPLLEKLETYLEEPRDITVTIDLDYFSTRSSKAMLEMFKLISDKSQLNNKEFIVEWYYGDDEDTLEAGEDYQSMVPKAEFKFIK